MTPPLGSQQKKGKNIHIALGAGLTALVALLFFLRLGSFEIVHSKLYDLSLQARGSPSVPQEVVIVAVDDASVARLGRWPWPRGKMAELIDLLSRAGAQAIAVDSGLSPRRGRGPPETTASWVRPCESRQRSSSFLFHPGKIKGRKEERETPAPFSLSSYLLSMTPKIFDFLSGGIEMFVSVPEVMRGARAMGHINALPDADGKCAGTC
jgi:hypothetical protein